VLIGVICIAVAVNNGQPSQPSDPVGTSGTAATTTVPDIKLEVESSVDDGSVTMEEKVVFTGMSDPAEGLTVNSAEVKRNADGSFIYEAALSMGENKIVFSHKGEQVSFTVIRRYALKSFTPSGDESYGSGTAVPFEVTAKAGSQVTAEFNGETVELTAGDPVDGFAVYTGSYKLPGTNTEDLDLGVITYTVICDNITETAVSGKIICRKSVDILASDPSVTPGYGDYVDVGSGYIVEIVGHSAETFDGDTTDDYSHPTNNYLPKGTMDYCSVNPVTNGSIKYMLMRCGRRVYIDKRNIPGSGRYQVSQCYQGQLPDHNEIGVVSMETAGHHTVLTLDCLWKAPFYFDLKPQTYQYPNGGGDRSYAISAYTAEYIDITFCYATQFTGTVEIPGDSRLFKSAEVIRNESDCILRLHLKKTGSFYGWDSFYNDKGQLCFSFLEPAAVSKADNAYGVDLTGVTVMIDVGHGGVDGGTVGKLADGTQVEEADRNLELAKLLQTQLESVGARVVLNRSTDVAIKTEDRNKGLRDLAPDLCVAIHQNVYGPDSKVSGFDSMFFTPFSQLAAKKIYEQTEKSEIYAKNHLRWNVYFTCRQSVCPVVLTENGYMTNPADLAGMINEGILAAKAQAIAQGIADYFLAINK
jgi:N-acetylmuramoyl-L-alanine amidase